METLFSKSIIIIVIFSHVYPSALEIYLSFPHYSTALLSSPLCVCNYPRKKGNHVKSSEWVKVSAGDCCLDTVLFCLSSSDYSSSLYASFIPISLPRIFRHLSQSKMDDDHGDEGWKKETSSKRRARAVHHPNLWMESWKSFVSRGDWEEDKKRGTAFNLCSIFHPFF